MKMKTETNQKQVEEYAKLWAEICIQFLAHKHKQNGDKYGKRK